MAICLGTRLLSMLSIFEDDIVKELAKLGYLKLKQFLSNSQYEMENPEKTYQSLL
jgi:predicted HicB family RNase H-like nuclease